MHFKEKQLVEKLEIILKKQFGTNIAFKELSTGYGIADLVFAEDFAFNKRKVFRRSPITNFNALQIFLNLSIGSQYNFEKIQSIFAGISTTELKKHLSNLEKSGYIKHEKKLYELIPETQIFNPIQKVIAIEAKLTDHRNGLIQARRYQYFADESYLAILKDTLNEAHIAEFERYNIGLILFDKETETVEIHHPTSNNNLFQDSLNLFAKEIMMDSFSKSVSSVRL